MKITVHHKINYRSWSSHRRLLAPYLYYDYVIKFNEGLLSPLWFQPSRTKTL